MENTFNKDLFNMQTNFAPEKGTKAYNYSYSNLSTILPALKKIGTEYTLMLKDVEMVNLQVIDKKVQVVLKIFWEFKIGGETHLISSIGIGTQSDGDKAIGSAMTYARRYVLMSIFNANDGGKYDPEQKDNVKPTYNKPQQYTPKQQPKSFQPQPTQEQMEEMMLRQGKQ